MDCARPVCYAVFYWEEEGVIHNVFYTDFEREEEVCITDADRVPLPVRVHTVYVWRTLQGGVCAHEHPSL